MGVSDRRLHVQLTQEAKNASDFSLIRAIFAFAGFVSARPSASYGAGDFLVASILGEHLAWRDVT